MTQTTLSTNKNMILLSNADAIKVMKYIPDKSIDFLFTDPPYGTTHNAWDVAFDVDIFMGEIRRVVKENGCIAVWGQAPFTYKLATAATDLFRYEWVVEKTSAKGFLNAKKMPLRAHENVLIFYKKRPVYNPQMTTGHPRKTAVRKNGTGTTNYGRADHESAYDSTERYPRSAIRFSWDTQKSRLHPTQKPLAACEYFIKTYTNPGMVVFDPFMGSGTTGVACKELGRHFIGIEKDVDIFAIARDRIAKNEKEIHQ